MAAWSPDARKRSNARRLARATLLAKRDVALEALRTWLRQDASAPDNGNAFSAALNALEDVGRDWLEAEKAVLELPGGSAHDATALEALVEAARAAVTASRDPSDLPELRKTLRQLDASRKAQ